MKTPYEEQLQERIRLNEIQDIKRACIAANNAEWVEWGESKCDNDAHGDTRYGVIKRMCAGCWQERKKSLEAKQ